MLLHLPDDFRRLEAVEALRGHGAVLADAGGNHRVVVAESRYVYAYDGAGRLVDDRGAAGHGDAHELGGDELVGALARELALYADFEEVGVFAVFLFPLSDDLLVGDRHAAAVNAAGVPVLRALVETLEETAGVTRRVPEEKHHRFAVG